jgi:hypothetical protein
VCLRGWRFSRVYLTRQRRECERDKLRKTKRLQFQRRGEGLLKFTPPELDYPGRRKKAHRRKRKERKAALSRRRLHFLPAPLPRRRIKLNNSARPICIPKLSRILSPGKSKPRPFCLATATHPLFCSSFMNNEQKTSLCPRHLIGRPSQIKAGAKHASKVNTICRTARQTRQVNRFYFTYLFGRVFGVRFWQTT